MEQLSLALPLQAEAGHIRQGPVHVPLDVLDVGGGEDLAELVIDTVPDLLPGQVQHQLGPAQHGGPSGDLEGVVRVGPEQVGIRAHHFRLHPQSELHPQLVDLVRQVLQPAGELLLIDNPVPQAVGVRIPAPEQAVVQHQHFNAPAGGGAGDVQKLLRVKLKVGGLPVVHQGGPGLVLPGAAGEVAAVEVVEGVGHAVQARAGVGQHRLRGLEALAGGQTPGKVPGMDADHRPQLLLLAHLHLGQEVAGVDQVHGVNLPLILGGGMLRQGQEGVLLGGGDALEGAGALPSPGHRAAAHHPLVGPAAVEGDEVKILVVHVQTGGKGGGEGDGLAAAVLDPRAAADHVQLLKGCVQQGNLQVQIPVMAPQLQCGAVPFAAVGGGQAGEGGLAAVDFVGQVGQAAGPVALRRLRLEAALPEVSQAVAGILHRQTAHQVRLPPIVPEVHSPGGQAQEVSHVVIGNPPAVVRVAQKALLIYDADEIGGTGGVQTEHPLLLVVINTHSCSFCFLHQIRRRAAAKNAA